MSNQNQCQYLTDQPKSVWLYFCTQECEKIKKDENKPHQTQEEYQQEITKELDELDKEGK